MLTTSFMAVVEPKNATFAACRIFAFHAPGILVVRGPFPRALGRCGPFFIIWMKFGGMRLWRHRRWVCFGRARANYGLSSLLLRRFSVPFFHPLHGNYFHRFLPVSWPCPCSLNGGFLRVVLAGNSETQFSCARRTLVHFLLPVLSLHRHIQCFPLECRIFHHFPMAGSNLSSYSDRGKCVTYTSL
ncbi:hypothetical protein DPX39_060009700 [Trypanosoma brucei equiperdum]|uniref:T. brucei spp.-specific protein n=1 Tax=Trypanosoma brucei equiperdum TaxID=630700 RepID=A0A3L6L6G0_9TRYP|nr:hypothetical protein DPX39_060009700 [Trypanosoma brucei equiperdum]